MFKQLQKLLLVVALCLPWLTQAQGTVITSFPFTCDFETTADNAYWSFQNAANGWYIGTATNNTTGGSNALYVSDDSGSTNSYSDSPCVSYAYLTFDIATAGQYAVQFDWKCYGESTYDFLRVAVAPSTTTLTSTYIDWTYTSVPTGFTAIDGGNKLNLQSSWQTQTAVVTVPAAGTYRLLFVWRNDGSVYNQPPAAIDNVVVTELTCPQPTALTAVPSVDELAISWTAGGTETEWKVTLNDTIVDYVSTTSYTATNLEGNTPYTVKVYAVCGAGDTSLATAGNFCTSCVPISVLPYSNGFEDAPPYTFGSVDYIDAFPDCWTRINDASGIYNFYPYITTTSTYVHSGIKGMWWHHSISTFDANNEYAVLPPVDLDAYDISDLTLAFYAKTTSVSYHPQPIVGVMTDPNDVSTFVPVRTFSATDITTTWQMFVVSFASYTGSGAYIAIKWPRPSSACDLAIDDIYLTDEWCNMPSNLTSTSTVDEITLSWNGNGASSFEVILGTDTIHGVTDTFYTFSNLVANTLYNYAVAAECTNSNSMYVTGSIRTLCTMLGSLPYSYGFEDLATGSSTVRPIIPCWYHLNNATTYFGYPYVSSISHTGSRSLYWYGCTTFTTYGDYQIVVLPGVDTNIYSINTLRLKFWARPSSTSYSPVFQVGVMSDPNDVTTFQNVKTVNVQNVTTWQEFRVLFANYTGPGQYVAVRLNRPSSSYYAYTDDFTLEEAPTCAPVVSHNVVTTAGAARITWSTDQDFANAPVGYEVSYSQASNISSPTTVTTTDTELTLTGLYPDRAYTVTIVADCGSSYNLAYTFNFSTQALPCSEWDTSGSGPAEAHLVSPQDTSTTYYMPVNNSTNYSYCQHLIRNSEINISSPLAISGIEFEYAYTQPMTHATNCTIYMAYTTQTSLDAMVPYAQLQKVYEGPLNCTTQGWNAFQFNQGNFLYNDTGNLVVAIVNNSGSSDGSSYVFYYNTPGGTISRREGGSTPYTPAAMDAATGNSSTWRTNMRLLAVGVDCIVQASCAAPAVFVEQDDNGYIMLSWIPGYQETSWNADYRASNATTWTNVVTGTSNTNATVLISDLQPNTEYLFRVTANCNDTNIATTVSFTTPCAFVSIPYLYGFEDMTTGSSSVHPDIPCWHHINNGTSYYGYPYVSSTAYNSSRSLYWYLTTNIGTYGDYEIVVLPPVDIGTNPINTLQLTFWAKPTSTSYAPVFLVGVMTDPEDVSTFQFVDSVILDHTTTDWMPYEVVLNSYTGTGRYVALRANRPSSTWYAYTDDFALENAPACPRITGVAASNITQNDATISWTATAAGEYEVVYGPSGFNLSAGTVVPNILDDSAYITDLASNTAYDVYVRGICTDDTSNWSFVYTFRTSCGLIATLPFFEDFENQATTSSTTGTPFIPCWTLLNNGTLNGNYPYLLANTTCNHTSGGGKGLYWYGSTTTGTYSDYMYLILPEIDTATNSINTMQLSFWAKSSSTSYNPVFQVGVMNSNTDTAMTVLDTINIAGNTEWTEYTTNLSSYQGFGGRFVAIRAFRPSSTWYAYVDDIKLELVPPCPRVEQLHAIDATIDSITIVWTDTSSTNTNWIIEYDTVEFSPGTGDVSPIIVADTFYVLDGLDPATTYHIYVYPLCNEYIGYRYITAATLVASPATVPYTCNFEEDGPNGWDFFNQGQTNYWIVGNATGNTGRSMYITNDGTTNNYNTSSISYSYAVRTFRFSDAGEYTYSFDWKCNGEDNYDFVRILYVPASVNIDAGVLPFGTSAYDFGQTVAPAPWIDLTGQTTTPYGLNMQNTWQNRTGVMHIGTPGNYKLVFVWVNDGSGGTQPPIVIDNVTLQKNECPMVQNVSAGVTADSISLSWTAGDNETEWYVTLDSASVSLAALSVDTNNYTFTGLYPNSYYSVNVRAVCGVGDTSLAYSEVFHTPCTAINVPYTENFDNLTTGTATSNLTVMPSCWDYILTGSSIYQEASYYPGVYYSSSNAHSGNYSLRLYGVGYFMLPPFTTPLDSLQLTFWDYTASTSYGLEVGVMEGNTFIPVQVVNTPGGTHAEVQVLFGSYTGNSRIIAFRNYYTSSSTTGYSYHYIDNINVDYIPSCTHVTNLTTTGNTANLVTVNWVENGGATEWDVAIETSATATPVADSTAYTHPFTINGLTTGASYYVWVRPVCGTGGTGIWEGPLQVTPGLWNMRANHTDTLHMCGSVIYDDAGPSTGYANSQDSYIILYPEAPNSLVNITGTVATQTCCDYVTIYDGVGTSGTELFDGYGTVNVTSTSGPLTIYFHTDGSVNSYQGFELHVDCITTSCMVTNLALDTSIASTSTSLAIMWDAVTGSTGYEIEYGAPGFARGNGSLFTSTNNHVVLNGLTALTNYEVFVRSLCSGGDTGSWIGGMFITPICDNVVMAENWVDNTMPSTTSSKTPMGDSFYKYGYVQTIIDSDYLSEMEDEIIAFAFHPSTANRGDYYNHITVYLANVPESDLSSAFIYPDDSVHIFVPVITDRNMCYTSSDWQLQPFDTIFTWDGHSNILVSVKRDHGFYSSGASFFAHNHAAFKSRYVCRDGGAYNPATVLGGYATFSVGDIRLYSCGVGCAKPRTMPVTDLSYNGATLNWSGNATDYEVAVKAATDATWPAETTVTTTTYTVSGLQPATQYQYRVRSICDSSEELISVWAMGTFVTDNPCLDPENLYVTTPGYSTTTLGWTANGTENQWSIHVWNTSFDEEYTANVNPFTVTGLTANTTYSAAVKAICGGGAAESEYSDTIQFTTATCAQVTGVTMGTITAHSAAVSWNDNGAENYEIQYGDRNFNQGEGTSVIVSGTSTTLTNLSADENYTLYVRAICEPGVYGLWSEQVDFSTPEGSAVNTVDGGMNVSICPNPTTGTTTIALSGVNGEVQITIVDMNGRTVMSDSMSCEGDCVKKMEVAGLAQGAYFVRINCENVNMVKKLVVK